jgi:predicted MarR family transcription regulator
MGGLKEHRLNACGYTMGAAYAPIWVDHPMIYADNPMVIKENMVFFLHMIIVNRDNRLADVCFTLNIEDTHTVAYSLRKITKLGLH